jgi:hypothetical protein
VNVPKPDFCGTTYFSCVIYGLSAYDRQTRLKPGETEEGMPGATEIRPANRLQTQLQGILRADQKRHARLDATGTG